MNENKKGVRAKKHKVAHIEPSKPRNFVAKNAIQGGAGAHKDKKKAMKQGDTKHKKSYAEHLDVMLKNALTETRQLNETGLDPIRRMKAIQFICNKTGWEKNYLELASDEELMDLYVKIKKGEPVGEGGGISKDKETKFHAKLDKLVHNTFGKRKDESVNPEYDDEAGMADNNLETLERAVQGIDDLINKGDNLPEWCQEKIAVAKSMLVTVWDYMKSEEEKGVSEGDDQNVYNVDWIEKVRAEVESGRDLDDALDDLRYELENEYDADENTVANILAKVEINLSDLRYGLGEQLQKVSEGSKVDRQAMHITKSMMKRHGMSRDEAEAAAWAHIKHPKKKKARKESVAEGAMDELYADLSDAYNKLAPSIEKYKDKKGAENLYQTLAAIAKQYGAVSEFKRMLNGAQNRAHLDYDTNPGGFENWFWYLPFADDQVDEACWKNYKQIGMKKKGGRTVPNCVPKEGWTHDSLAAQLFEQELTYEDKLNNMLAKKIQK